jgi:hypothetical protein
MEILKFDPSEQRDIAVDLGVVPEPLAEIECARVYQQNMPTAPPQIVDGILHQGCKMLLAGTSKSNKSWCLLEMAMCVASGANWWGRRCAMMPVVYINFELPRWAVGQRLGALWTARPELVEGLDRLHMWNLRGQNADLTLLRPKLEEKLDRHQFGLIIVDPAYKVLGNRDENANGEIADLMNELEGLVQRTKAGLVIAHHFAKGDSTAKSAIDRMSGAGAWARDPDSLVVLTPHEEPQAFTVSTILRNLPMLDEFVLQWDFPLMRLAPHLNPDALRKPQSRNKVCTDNEFVEQLITDTPAARGTIVAAAAKLGISRGSVDRYLARLTAAGLICCGNGLYWRAKRQ